MKDLEGGTIEVLGIPSSLGKFIREACDLMAKSGGVGGGLIHLQLSGHFELLLNVGEWQVVLNVGGFIRFGVGWDFEVDNVC